MNKLMSEQQAEQLKSTVIRFDSKTQHNRTWYTQYGKKTI